MPDNEYRFIYRFSEPVEIEVRYASVIVRTEDRTITISPGSTPPIYPDHD